MKLDGELFNPKDLGVGGGFKERKFRAFDINFRQSDRPVPDQRQDTGEVN